jgi:MFS transporter, FSR family, fosmidomycin resistance protein
MLRAPVPTDDGNDGVAAGPPPSAVVRAPALRQATTRHRRLVGRGNAVMLLALAHIANDALATLLAVLLPSLQARFGLTGATLALLVGVSWVSSSVTQPFFGALADRVERRLVATIGVAVGAVTISLLGVAPAPWVLFALLAVGGLGSAALHPVGTAIVHTEGATGNRDLSIGLFSAGGQIGYALGPPVILALVAAFGLGATPWLMLPGVGLAVLLYVLLPPGEPRATRVGPRVCRRCLANGRVAVLVASGVLADLAYVAFTSAMPLWLVHERQVPDNSGLIAWTLTVFSVGAVVGALTGSLLVARIGRRILISGSMLLAVGPMLAVLWLPVGGLGFFVTVTLAGALVGAKLPLMIVAAQDLAPNAMAAASGLLMGLTTGVAGLLYVGIGWLQDMIGLTAALGVSYLALPPAALLSWWALPGARKAEPYAPLLAA